MVPPPASGRVYTHAVTPGLGDVAPDRRARLDAIARWLQDAAWADVVDSGVADDGVWIVRRMAPRRRALPALLASRSSSRPSARAPGRCGPSGAPRVRGADGGLVEAVALWVHLDPTAPARARCPPASRRVYGAAAAGPARAARRLRTPAAPPDVAPRRRGRSAPPTSTWPRHVNNAAYWTVAEEELAGRAPGDGFRATIEHRAPGGAGPARVASAGAASLGGSMRMARCSRRSSSHPGRGLPCHDSDRPTSTSSALPRRQRLRLDRRRARLLRRPRRLRGGRRQLRSTPPTSTPLGPGTQGGESETIIGDWLARPRQPRPHRGRDQGRHGQGRARRGRPQPRHSPGRRASLRRLRSTASTSTTPTSRTRETPLEDTLAAFDRSSATGSRAPHRRLQPHRRRDRARRSPITERDGLARSDALQAHYNLARPRLEPRARSGVAEHGLARPPYFGLAKGFLTGKYRPGGSGREPARRERGRRPRGPARHRRARGARRDRPRSARRARRCRARLAAHAPTVVAPIASARTPEQLRRAPGPRRSSSSTDEEADAPDRRRPGRGVSGRAGYPHVLAIPTRWKDNDVYGHVNNVEYYSYFDTVINHYLIAEGGLDIHAGEVIGLCAESHCTLQGGARVPRDRRRRRCASAQLGRSSVRYEIGLFRGDDDEPAAEGWFVTSSSTARSRRPAEIPGPLREALQQPRYRLGERAPVLRRHGGARGAERVARRAAASAGRAAARGPAARRRRGPSRDDLLGLLGLGDQADRARCGSPASAHGPSANGTW